jgi:putative Mg2+ transporter-C (MgtC) family protein
MDQALAEQLDLALRLIVAAVLGAAIGLEREIHEHPAGMRTHLLVSVGSAAFTVLSIFAFPAVGADPARVAAQIVTGVGFLGAGAILKEGATIHGLTTAASLWAVAAVGMAAGAGAWGVAVVATIIVILSLWPLRVITYRFVGREQHRLHLKLATADPHRLGVVVETVSAQGGTIAELSSSHALGTGLVADIEVRLTDVSAGARLTAAIADLDGIELIEARAVGD